MLIWGSSSDFGVTALSCPQFVVRFWGDASIGAVPWEGGEGAALHCTAGRCIFWVAMLI